MGSRLGLRLLANSSNNTLGHELISLFLSQLSFGISLLFRVDRDRSDVDLDASSHSGRASFDVGLSRIEQDFAIVGFEVGYCRGSDILGIDVRDPDPTPLHLVLDDVAGKTLGLGHNRAGSALGGLHASKLD